MALRLLASPRFVLHVLEYKHALVSCGSTFPGVRNKTIDFLLAALRARDFAGRGVAEVGLKLG